MAAVGECKFDFYGVRICDEIKSVHHKTFTTKDTKAGTKDTKDPSTPLRDRKKV
jgi:hypothetical protein